MQITNAKLKELLVDPGIITPADFDLAAKQALAQNKDLPDVLIENNFVADEQLGQLLANEIGAAFFDLGKTKIDEQVLNLIPEVVARTKGVVAFARDGEGVKIGMVNPEDLEMKHQLEKQLGEKIIPFFITKRGLTEVLMQYKANIKDEFNKILAVASGREKNKDEQDQTIIKLVDLLLEYGYQNKASDIHIEPYEKKVMVRFRIDGIMHDVLEMPNDLSEFIISRIKVLAKMRTDEHRSAQDGKLSFAAGGSKIDVRVSIVPVIRGENMVLRILSEKNRQFSLNSLGLSDSDTAKLKKTIKNPHGMLLITGPTGSGKTTSLYAILKILNRREVHISTIEDPVEYDIEGISQIQVDPKTNLTFAKGLRAIVRQDPDIIMVGEIRDEETAAIAVNSALTGHLVLSTLHTNDAVTTLPRLLDMGIEPFLVASTVNAVIAQRLVRVICEKCRSSYLLTDEEKNIIASEPDLMDLIKKQGHKNLDKLSFYKGEGCSACGNTGYSGRIGIFEILEVEENIRELIIAHAASSEIMKAARKNGMTTMLADGITKVLNGQTTFSEIFRVTRV